MAGALDLLLYGVAIFISPVAVFLKKGAGVQFWVNCCLYCLLVVPGMIHAFYIIHTNKHDKKARHQPSQSPETQQYSQLASLPHPDRYRPAEPFSPYESYPPPLPPKREDTLPYDTALHPNAKQEPIARAKAVLHTYQIPESTLHPAPESRRARRPVPAPEPPELPARPQPQPQQEQPPPLPPRSAPAVAPDSNNPEAPLHYPAGYHPNAGGKNIANAKAVLHTYQIPETVFSPPTPEPEPQRPEPTTNQKARSMFSLRSRGKGLSPLDVTSVSPASGSKQSSRTSSRSNWHAGPSWLHRKKDQERTLTNAATTDEESEPSAMTMAWDDKRDRPRLGQSGGRTKSPADLSFPMPPGAVRPVVDRTGTSNTILRRPAMRNKSSLGPVTEREEGVMSEGEVVDRMERPSLDDGTATDTERRRHLILRKLARRTRPGLDATRDTPNLVSAPSAIQATAQAPNAPSPPEPTSPPYNRSPSSPKLSHHIASPATLSSSFDEFRRTSSSTSPSSPTKDSIEFRIAELGFGRAADAYSAGSRALQPQSRDRERERRGSLGPSWSPRRPSIGTATSPVSDEGINNAVPITLSRGLTRGTFGNQSTSNDGSSERKVTPRSEDYGEEEMSPDDQVEQWIKREDERSQLGHSDNHNHLGGPDTASIFTQESGFAGIGVGSAQEKGRAGKIEIWDRPNWDGSNPSEHNSAQQQHASYHEHDPFLDPTSSVVTHSSYATAPDKVHQPLSPPTSPRPSHPARPPPPPPEPETPTKPSVLRMDTFGASSFGLLSPPATERIKGKGKAKEQPPPVPVRPGARSPTLQSPKLPPKPTMWRSVSGVEEDDMSEVYARALRDER